MAPSTMKQLVVLDIDGTLTPQNLFVYETRPDAARAIRAFSEKGYQITYVTTRIPLFHFQSGLPDWLRQNGFPEGRVHAAQTAAERGNPKDFKTRVLRDYVQHGWQLTYAYGDSESDFWAYAEVEIPKQRVFALKRRFSQECVVSTYQACLGGWTEHLPYIERDVPSAK